MSDTWKSPLSPPQPPTVDPRDQRRRIFEPDTYFNVPLSILRSGSSELEALENACSCGILSAGIGERKVHGAEEFEETLEEAEDMAADAGADTERPHGTDPDLWNYALVGAHTLEVHYYDAARSLARDVAAYQAHHRHGNVFFRMRSDWMWNALRSAGKEVQLNADEEGKPLSWREFRLLAAILSAQRNSYDFAFIGWETLQARACGFHSKALFRAGAAALPAHCQPLSRDVIRREVEKLEALRFFVRCRYAKGGRGGFMAYSFRHPERYHLLQAVQLWRANTTAFQTQVAANRDADLAAFQKPAGAALPAYGPLKSPARTAPASSSPGWQSKYGEEKF